MSLHARFDAGSNRRIATEFGFVAAMLVGVSLWHRLVRIVTESLSPLSGTFSTTGGLWVGVLATGGLSLAGLTVLAGFCAASRDLDVGLALPSRSDLTLVGVALALPVALVALTKLVGAVTGVPYSTLTLTYYGTDVPLGPTLTVIGVGLLVGVPSLVLICQVLVQGSFERVTDGDGAVALTALVAGFAMTDHSGLSTVPGRGKLVGVALFVFTFVVALYATEHSRAPIRYLGAAPVLLFVALVVSAVTGAASLADGLFGLTHLAVLGVAAFTYERSGSLLVPALAYLSLSLANYAVVIVFEAGGVSPL